MVILRRLFPFRLIIILVWVAAVLPVSPAQPVHAQDQVLWDLLGLINAERAGLGLTPLTFNSALMAAADRHSNDMATNNFLSHTGSDGSTFWDRIVATGYGPSLAGENILLRWDSSALGAFNQWKSSPPHYGGMVNINYGEAGLSYVRSPTSGAYYFTLVLGTNVLGPAASPPAEAPAIPLEQPAPTTGTTTTTSSSTGSTQAAGTRLNAADTLAPIAVFCAADGGVALYLVDMKTSVGYDLFTASRGEIGSALSQALSTGRNTAVRIKNDVGLYALTSNELQAQFNPGGDASRASYKFVFAANTCGTPTVIPGWVAPGAPSAPATTPATTSVYLPTYPTYLVPTGVTGVHIVQPGETLARIALRYGVTTTALAAANGIANPNLIYAGQQLLIPGYSYATTTVPTTTIQVPVTTIQVPTTPIIISPPATTWSGKTHIVQPGENLFRIGLRYGVPFTTLAAYNGILDPTRIYAGQVIRIP